MDLLEQCELDDEKLMGKSSRQRGPKVGESERDVGRCVKLRENRGHVPHGTREKVQRRVSERASKREGGVEAGRQMPGANAHRKHIGRDSEK